LKLITSTKQIVIRYSLRTIVPGSGWTSLALGDTLQIRFRRTDVFESGISAYILNASILRADDPSLLSADTARLVNWIMGQPLNTKPGLPAVRVGSRTSGSDAGTIAALVGSELSETPIEFTRGTKCVIVLGYLLAWAAIAYLITVKAHGSWIARVTPILQIIGVYSLSLTFAGALGGIQRWLGVTNNEMTSPNVFRFTRANLGLVIGLALLITTAIPRGYKWLASIPFALMTGLYMVLHVLVIMPLTYLAYALAGWALDGLNELNSGGTVSGAGLAEPQQIGAALASQQSTIKGLLVGIPALLLAVALGFVQVFHV